MIEIVTGFLKINYNDIFANLIQFNKFNLDFIIETNITKAPLLLIWSLFIGRYISFAVNIAILFEAKYLGIFNFQYYDVDKYRIVYYKSIGIFIDSFSAVGPIVLKENQQWINLNGINRHWKYINRISIYKRTHIPESKGLHL